MIGHSPVTRPVIDRLHAIVESGEFAEKAGSVSEIDGAGAYAEALVKRVGTIEPDLTYRAEYDDKYEQYKRMYAAAKAVYGRE